MTISNLRDLFLFQLSAVAMLRIIQNLNVVNVCYFNMNFLAIPSK